MTRPFVPAVDAPADRSSAAWWFIFRRERLLVQQIDDAARVPFLERLDGLALPGDGSLYLGRLDGHDSFAVELDGDAALPDGLSDQPLRGLYGRLPNDLFSLAGRASQLVVWNRTHRFCGHCGTPTVAVPGERAKECPACGLRSYPRISPAVIVLVTRGDRMLLTRGVNFPEGFYAALAGFVEPGETLEEAVAREIQEEVGLDVTEIRYFGSQPWPFPHQLMVGFTATWAGGEIAVDHHELADAAWFTRDSLPHIPPRMSIARRLIDWFVATP